MSQLQRIAANLSGQVKHVTHDGRDYLVAPAIAIKAPAVLNGELILPEEVNRYVEAWNGMILPIGHPKDQVGNFISANTPELEAQALGRFYNASFKDGRLHGELWIDTERAKALGGEALVALERLETGQPLELSTGYYRDLEETPGVFEGVAYNAIARNLRPNHLALLPSEVGACSWLDGCGAPRVNQKGAGMQVNEMDYSDSAIIAFYPSAADAQALASAVGALPGGSEALQPSDLHLTLAYLGKLEEIGANETAVMRELARWVSDMPIMRVEVGGLIRFNRVTEDGTQAVAALIDSPNLPDFQRSLCYWMEDAVPISKKYGFIPHITLAYVPQGQEVNIPIPERREIVFDAVAISWGTKTTMFRLQGEAREMQGNKAGGIKRFLTNLAHKFGINLDKEDSNVSKKDLIAALVANKRCPLPQTALEKLDEGELKVLNEMAEQAPTPATQPAQEAQPAQPAQAPNQPQQQASDEPPAWAKALLSEWGEIKATLKTNADQERAALIEELAANQQALPKAALEKLSTDELRGYARTFIPVDYSGRGVLIGNRQQGGGDWEDYEAPDLLALPQNGAGQGGAK